ncbi:hypothetical protein GOP47_0001745 [Adiantum capillus-veneris]|uniref:Uncharacterized protein n=1 Tax=Adiantum capillus-veneris TaxID=13818 RepID=A0A9D4VAN1_ADICA|nr:hypothetical protein GOP47_0001745 [Adiantum capillus-veneris]
MKTYVRFPLPQRQACYSSARAWTLELVGRSPGRPAGSGRQVDSGLQMNAFWAEPLLQDAHCQELPCIQKLLASGTIGFIRHSFYKGHEFEPKLDFTQFVKQMFIILTLDWIMLIAFRMEQVHQDNICRLLTGSSIIGYARLSSLPGPRLWRSSEAEASSSCKSLHVSRDLVQFWMES